MRVGVLLLAFVLCNFYIESANSKNASTTASPLQSYFKMMRKFTGDDDYDEDMDERDYDDDNRFEGYFNSRYSFNDPPVMSRRAQTDEERWRGRRPRRMRSQFARRKFPPMFPPGFRPFFVPYPMPVYY